MLIVDTGKKQMHWKWSQDMYECVKQNTKSTQVAALAII